MHQEAGETLSASAPLPGARGCSTFKGRNSRLQHACKKFLGVRATASCSPPTRQSLPVVLLLHGAIHRQAGGKVIIYSVCGECHAERPCGLEPSRRVRLFLDGAIQRNETLVSLRLHFFSGKTENFHSIFIPIPRLPRYNIPSNTKEN